MMLLEARDRLGGRINTVQVEDRAQGEYKELLFISCQGNKGGVLELGAQWIHGGSSNNSVWRLAKEGGLLGQEVGCTTRPNI